jgi:hypothetical protein
MFPQLTIHSPDAWIRQIFAEKMRVKELAKHASMSATTFRQHSPNPPISDFYGSASLAEWLALKALVENSQCCFYDP